VAVVTGANKGIGYEISRELAQNGLTTVMTARDTTRGSQAVEFLKKELGPPHDQFLTFHPLDVTSNDSALAFSNWLQETYGGADILINNAGVLYNEETLETITTTLETNYYGVKKVTKAVLPILRPGARIIMASSGLGQLRLLGNHYRAEFTNREALTEQKVDEFVESYLRAKKGGKGPGGWPGAYCVSKMALNGYMSVLARELSDQNIHVNSFSPGYTRTGMTGGHGTNSAAEGAMTAVWLALHPPADYPHGKFWGEKCRGEMSF